VYLDQLYQFISEALLGVFRILDIWGKYYWDARKLGEKLMG